MAEKGIANRRNKAPVVEMIIVLTAMLLLGIIWGDWQKAITKTGVVSAVCLILLSIGASLRILNRFR